MSHYSVNLVLKAVIFEKKSDICSVTVTTDSKAKAEILNAHFNFKSVLTNLKKI